MLFRSQLTEEEREHPISLENYFKTNPIPNNGFFDICGTKFEVYQMTHVVNRAKYMPAYGLFVTTPGKKKVFITTDTQFAPYQLFGMYREADVIIHDCETSKFPSGVHAHYKDLRTLEAETKKKMILCHYNDGEKPDCVADGFQGWAAQGQSWEFE